MRSRIKFRENPKEHLIEGQKKKDKEKNKEKDKEYETNHIKEKCIGLLLVILCSLFTGIFMNYSSKDYVKKAEKEIKTQKAEEEKEIDRLQQEEFHVTDEYIDYMIHTIFQKDYENKGCDDKYFITDEKYRNYNMPNVPVNVKTLEDQSIELVNYMDNLYQMYGGDNGYYAYLIPTESLSSEENGMNFNSIKESGHSAIEITIDEKGNLKLSDSWKVVMTKEQKEQLITRLQNMTVKDFVSLLEEKSDGIIFYTEEGEVAEDPVLYNMVMPKPKGLKILFEIDMAYGIHYYSEYNRDAYLFHGYVIVVLGILFIMMILALILQNVPYFHMKELRLFRFPTEVIITLISLFFVFLFDDSGLLGWFGIGVMRGDYLGIFQRIGFQISMLPTIQTLVNVGIWACFAFGSYWVCASVLPYIVHPIRTFTENCILWRIVLFLKKQTIRLYHWATDVDLDKSWNKTLMKILGLNFLIVSFICCLWFAGIGGAVIYTIVIYFVLKNKLVVVKKDYDNLLLRIRKIAGGDFSAEEEEDLGIFHPIRDELNEIQNGFKRAVNEEVRSQNMKTELITNVSHDLKTPLTAMITYIDLLKKEDITEEERTEYIETLEKKSQRLKILIEDLFEVSKATSNNIVMNYADVDMVSLLKQLRLENEEKIKESGLDFRWKLPDEKCILSLDPNRTYRIMDNLLQNILKYSLAHSRVYINLDHEEDAVKITFRNISATEMNFTKEEITERFVRGDQSRNSEGSGLGLAIAKSFTEIQGGTFVVDIDGDLFKVTLAWKREIKKGLSPKERE